MTTFYAIETPVQMAPLFQQTLTNVSFLGVTIGPQDIITNYFYSAANTTEATIMAQYERQYQSSCFNTVGYDTPICFNTTSQAYCTFPFTVGLGGPSIANMAAASAYMLANVSAALTLNRASGCWEQLVSPSKRATALLNQRALYANTVMQVRISITTGFNVYSCPLRLVHP
jgi:hypothetical protein